MDKLIKAGRTFYGIAMAGIGIQQFFYFDFRPVILPSWFSSIPGLAFWAWLTGAALLAAGIAIIFGKWARTVSLVLGGTLLLFFCCCQVPYEIIADPHSKHLALWTDALKELALSGGAFLIAGTFPERNINIQKSFLLKLLEKIIPSGSIFFSITMISFGIDHLLYTQGVSTLIPAWIPDHIFWTYFAAVALIGSGVAVILEVSLKRVGILLGNMLFLWFVLLHIPRAIVNPFMDKGNEVTSVFEALGFSGIAFVIACKDMLRKR